MNIDPSDSDEEIMREVAEAIANADAVNEAVKQNEKAGITEPVDKIPEIEKGIHCRKCMNESLRYYEATDMLICDKCKEEFTGYMFLSKRVAKFGKDYKTEDLI